MKNTQMDSKTQDIRNLQSRKRMEARGVLRTLDGFKTSMSNAMVVRCRVLHLASTRNK